MFAPADAADRREQILGDVAEGLHLVFKETQRRVLEAEDNDEFVQLAATLCNVARGVRQCLGLHAKLERGRLADAAEMARSEAETHAAEVLDRRAAIARKVARRFNAAWPDEDDEDENHVFNQRLESLNERLDGLCDDEDFLDLDPDALVARLCEEFGLPPPDPLIPLIPAKAGTQADSPPPWAAPAPRPNGRDAPPPDSS